MKRYEKPSVTDYGTLLDLTAGEGSLGTSDGVAFTIRVGVGDVIDLSIGVLP